MNRQTIDFKPGRFLSRIIFALVFIFSMGANAQQAMFEKQDIFPFQHLHAHGSTIVELQNGDLLAAWFQGSGERWADDVVILGARKKSGASQWSPPFLLADVKEFPDINPVLFIDGHERLWLMWYTVIANQWSTALLHYRLSKDYLDMHDAPVWYWQENLFIKPGDKAEHGILPGDRFVESVNRQLSDYGAYIRAEAGEEAFTSWEPRAERMRSLSAGEDMILPGRGAESHIYRGWPYFRRLSWQTRSKPVITEGGRMVLPLYSDGLGFCLMAYTDDWGENWLFSEPLVGTVEQPTIAIARSGRLVAYMRNNGRYFNRLHVSYSDDQGESWSSVRHSDFPNPASAADVVTLDDGSWAMIYNDTERGRHSLVVSLSEDDGATWPWTRVVELGESGTTAAHYPAIIQGKNGILHATYTLFTENEAKKNIVYATFNKAWIKSE